MKGRSIIYWVVTGLFAAFMLLSAIPDVLRVPDAVAIFGHLGYPPYLLPFLGTAKVLGVAVVLLQGLKRFKEWAYAGLVFDLFGALYSHLSVGDGVGTWMFPVIGLTLAAGSYISWRSRTSGNVQYFDPRSYGKATA